MKLAVTSHVPIVALAIMLANCASQPKSHDAAAIVFTRTDGTPVTVPLTGAARDARAENLARQIAALDAQVKAASNLPASEVRTALLQVVTESRDDALRELQLALDVARKTSAGTLDDATMGKAEEYAHAAGTVLNTQPPASILVGTHISASVGNATLHYLSKGKYDAKSTQWSSYSDGERLRIGRYVFRVTDPAATVYDEIVLVTFDPTQKKLTPTRQANR